MQDEQSAHGESQGETSGCDHESYHHDIGETLPLKSKTKDHRRAGHDIEDLFEGIVELSDTARDQSGRDLEGREGDLSDHGVGGGVGRSEKPVHPIMVIVQVLEHTVCLDPAGIGQGEPVPIVKMFRQPSRDDLGDGDRQAAPKPGPSPRLPASVADHRGAAAVSAEGVLDLAQVHGPGAQCDEKWRQRPAPSRVPTASAGLGHPNCPSGIGPGEIAKAFPQGTVLSLDGRPCEHSDGDDGEHDGVDGEYRETEGGHN